MNEIANQLVQSLFKKNSLQDCSRWELEILAEHYPYFGIAQLLVTGKLKEEDTEAYKKQVQKTSLYFTNPLWLDYILNKKSFPPEEFITSEKAGTNSIAAATIDVTNPVDAEPVNAEQGFTEPVITEELPVENLSFTETNEVPEEIITEEYAENNNVAGEVINPAEAKPTTIAEEPVVENPGLTEANEIPEEIIASQPEPGIHEQESEEFKIAPLKTEPLPDENAPLVFEAFHTVDYFASQGIKLSLEEKPQDRFGQQLKSFTQWLKTIKKIPAAEMSKETGTGTEQKVITLAEHSIEDREVVTEAMAEVWLKQGNHSKAIEVYRKLSLQNPAKSSYFAGLIEQLKQP